MSLPLSLDRLLAAFASAFDQRNRLVTLSLGDGSVWRQRLLPLAVDGREGLSDCHRYDIECLSPEIGLDLSELLGVPARLAIRDADGGEVVRAGVVTAAHSLSSDGGFARYRLVVEPPLALLKLRRASRTLQHRSVDAIVKQILAEHARTNPVFSRQQVEFRLLRPLPERSYANQYNESDYRFIARLLAEEGLAWRFEHIDDVVPELRLIVSDDPYFAREARVGRVRFHRQAATEAEDGLMRWAAERRLTPASVCLSTHDYKEARAGRAHEASAVEPGGDGMRACGTLEDHQAQAPYYASNGDELQHYARRRQAAHDASAHGHSGAGNVRGLLAGDWFRLEDHPEHAHERPEAREFVVTALRFAARNNLPGDLAAVGADGVPYQCEFNACRRGGPLMPAYAHSEHAKPTAPAVQTATVVGPAGEVVHTDALGRVKIQFHWQRPQDHPDGGAAFDDASSCWVRVAQPSVGVAFGHQFIPRIGQEVVVAFVENDIDRPLIISSVYDGRHPPPYFSGVGALPANKALSGIQSREHHGSGYNELLFDDTSGKLRTRLSSEHGKTQLNLGYLTHPREEGKAAPRGEGFELRTDLSGAIRAAQGLLLSAHGQSAARGVHLERDGLVSQLELALSIARQLADQAATHEAETTDTASQEKLIDDLKRWEGGGNTRPEGEPGAKGVVGLSAPDGVALTSETTVSVATGTHDLVAAQDSNHSVGRRLRFRIGESLSVFVQRMGMKLIAAAGKIRIQAQSDGIEIGAAKRLHLYSLEEIVLEAPKITLRAEGAGATLGGGSYRTHAAGTHAQHAASHVMDGPQGGAPHLPDMPAGTDGTDEQFHLAGRGGQPRPEVANEIRNGEGQLVGGGASNASGAAARIKRQAIERLNLQLKRK